MTYLHCGHVDANVDGLEPYSSLSSVVRLAFLPTSEGCWVGRRKLLSRGLRKSQDAHSAVQPSQELQIVAHSPLLLLPSFASYRV